MSAVVDLTQSPPSRMVDLTQSRTSFPIGTRSSQESLADDDDDDGDGDHAPVPYHLGSLTCPIVGIRYYTGVAHPGEFVNLVREPNNPYDNNAIRVDNIRGDKVGHIKATIAKNLAPFMDKFKVNSESSNFHMDGTIKSHGNEYSLPLEIDFLVESTGDLSGYTRSFQEVDAFFRSRRCHEWNPNRSLASEGKETGKDSESIEVVRQTVKWETAQENLDRMFDQLVQDQLASLPSIEIPPSISTPLLEHQIDGIRWMHHHEMQSMSHESHPSDHGTAAIPFYKQVQERGRTMWLCEITNATQATPPSPIKGSILADDMGLGKSLQAIGLILANPPKAMESKTTLIVCPLSVISNWMGQIEQHVVPSTLKVGIYHGPDRFSLLSTLSELDVLVAPYGTIAADYGNVFSDGSVKANGKKENKPPKQKKMKHCKGNALPSIFENKFYRIILDEAHTIRNIKSKTYAGCMALQSTYRLCLTGTPLQNKPEDIHSLLSFLAVEPLADRTIFRRSIGQPIFAGDPIGLSRLRMVMAHIALRRNKTKLDLVSKTVELRSIVFPENCAHKKIHDTVYAAAQAVFQAALSLGDKQVSKNYMKILEILMRIRQSCISGNLVPKECVAASEHVLQLVKGQGLSPEDGERLLEKLKGTFSDSAECVICFDTIEENEAVIIRRCSHIFCEPCLYKVSKQCNGICPLCRLKFEPEDMIKSSEVVAATMKPKAETMNELGPSPKLRALAVAISEMQSDEKGVIFSQFTKMLDLLEVFLKNEGHTFVRIDGTKSSAQRLTAMKDFSTENGGRRFILCSLHAAGTGITLTRGNHCFMMDTWWNSSVEQQAMDRIHRIGQQRPVRIIRFVMKDTIEERMISLQEAKAAIGKGSMEKLKPDEVRKARLGDLKSLFSIKESQVPTKAIE